LENQLNCYKVRNVCDDDIIIIIIGKVHPRTGHEG